MGAQDEARWVNPAGARILFAYRRTSGSASLHFGVQPSAGRAAGLDKGTGRKALLSGPFNVQPWISAAGQ